MLTLPELALQHITNIERNIMEKDNLKRIADAVFSTEQLKSIADAMEEILRLGKKDMEKMEKIKDD